MPRPKRSAPVISSSTSSPYKVSAAGPTHRRIDRCTVTMAENGTQVKQSVKQTTERCMTVTPKQVCIKEVTKNERSVTFDRNSPNRSITPGPYKNYSSVREVQNYSPARGAQNSDIEVQDYSPTRGIQSLAYEIQNYSPEQNYSPDNNYSPYNFYNRGNFY